MKTISPPTGGINRWRTETLVRRALNAKNDDARWNFIVALHCRGTKEVFDIAVHLCGSKNYREREIGADILGQLWIPAIISPEEVLRILRDMLRTESNADVLTCVIVAIGHAQDSDDPSELDLVIDKRHHENEDVRDAVTWTLGSHRDPASISALIELTSDPADNVRDWATFGLGTLNETDSKRIRDALWKRVSDSHIDTKCEAILGLAKRHDERVRPILLDELEQESPRSLIFEAAAEFGDLALLPHLRAIRKKAKTEKNINIGWLKDLHDAIRELQNKKKDV